MEKMENNDRQQDGANPEIEITPEEAANAGDVEIVITPEEAAAMEKEHERLEMQRFAERALERERLRAEELEHERVITKARELAMEPENVERHRVSDEIRRGAEEMQRPKEDAQERQERLAKFADEWLQREQQLKERSQQPVEKTEPENLEEHVQSQYKWAKNYLRDNDQKWLLENDSNFREDWLEVQPPDDPFAKEIRERFPMREEKHMDEPVNGPGAGDAVETGSGHAPGEEGVDRTDEPIIDSDKDVLEGYYRDVGDEDGADRTDEPANDPVAKDTVKTASGHDPGEDGADRADEPVNDPVVEDTFEGGFGYGPGDEDGAGYMDDSGIDFGRDSFEGDSALSGFGEHAYEPLGDVGESFEDSSFDSAWSGKEDLEGYYRDGPGDEDGVEHMDEPVNDPAVRDTFEDGFGYDHPGEDDAGYMDDSGRDSFEGDPALSGFGEHAYEPLGDVGESFEDSSFDSAW